MRETVETHGIGEMARDWDVVLATMTDECIYRFYPYGLQVTGVPAQTEMWSRFFTEAGPLPCFDFTNRLPDGAETTEYVTGDSLLRMGSSSFLDPDGVRLRATHVTRFDFRYGLVDSETVFLDATFMRWTDAVFDATFRALPGVAQI